MNAPTLATWGSQRPGHDVVERDGSVRPLEDTGFRAQPTEPFTYVPRENPVKKSIWDIDTVNEGDITSRTLTRLRGVNYITINTEKARQRRSNEIDKIITDRVKRELAREEKDAALIEA
jgi:hypothetical protein